MAQAVTEEVKDIVSTNDGGNGEPGQLPTIFTKSKSIEIVTSVDSGTRILSKIDAWHLVGVDYEIDTKSKTRFTVKFLAPRKCDNMLYGTIGFATKDVINTIGYNHIGFFTYGFDLHVNGHMYFRGKTLQWTGRNIAINDQVSIEFDNWNISIYIDNEKIFTYDENIFKPLKDANKSLYPAISICGDGCIAQIVSFQTQ